MRQVTNRLNWIVFIFVLIQMLLASCGITYKVRNQFSEIDYIMNFPCGKVSVDLIGKGNSTFTLRQEIQVENEISVNVDSILISCNHLPVLLTHSINRLRSDAGWIEIAESITLESSFKLDKGVFEGDTILVYGNGYLRCNDNMISLDSLIYSFVNNFRIKGVNDF